MAFTPVTTPHSFTSHDNITLENEHWSGKLRQK